MFTIHRSTVGCRRNVSFDKSFTAEGAEDAEEGPGKPHRGGREENNNEFNLESAKTTPREVMAPAPVGMDCSGYRRARSHGLCGHSMLGVVFAFLSWG